MPSAFINMAATGAEPNLNILTIPEEKARLAPFPPSCRVLAHFPDTTTPIVSGSIGRIFVDLFSSSRENQYVVIPDDNPNASNQSNAQVERELVATESCLCYGPGCPVYLKSSTASILSSVPGMSDMISSSADGNRLEATVMSAYRTTFQAGTDSNGATSSRWMYSLEVTTHDEKAVTRHGISQGLVSYRHVDEKKEKKRAVEFSIQTKEDCTSVSNSASPSASPSKPPSINTQSSFSKDDDECSSITISVSGRPNLKRASSADASLSLSSDARPRNAKRVKTEENDDSSSTRSTTDAVHVRRIDIPKHVAFYYITGKLIGTKGTTCKELEAKLGIKYDVIHRQLKASHRHLGQTRRYGDIAPIRGSPNCIMIKAKTRETAKHAVKVVVHVLSNDFRGKEKTSGEILKQELLESVQEATIQDPNFYKLTFSSSTDSGNVPKADSIAYNRIGPVKSWRGQNDVEVRRIVCPSYLSLGKLRGALIGPAGANKDELVRKMSAQLWFCSPRDDEWHKKRHVLFGNLLPVLDHPCIMLRAGNEDTANDAVEIMIDELCKLFPLEAQLREDLISSVAGTTVEDEGFVDPSTSECDDGSSSNNMIDPNYIFSTDSFTNSDDDEETWGHRKKGYQANRRRNVHRKHSRSERSGGHSARSSGGHTRSRTSYMYEPTTWSRSPRRSRPNIVTPAKRPAPTIDSALSSKR